MKKKLKIGIVGCGAIGSRLAMKIQEDFSKEAELACLCDIDKKNIRSLIIKLKKKPEVMDLEGLIKKSDLIIEAASSNISGGIVEKAIQNGKDIIVMSVGGLLNLKEKIFKLAKNKNVKIYIPSGAIAGVDALKAASMGKIKKVSLVTRKPIKSLKNSLYLKQKKINLDKIKKEKVIFEGNALEAVYAFPQNINVCATLSLAGMGSQNTEVKIITSPKYSRNIHEIHIESEAGRIITRTENFPCPDNPKTSYLAYLSAVATLEQILEPVKIGT